MAIGDFPCPMDARDFPCPSCGAYHYPNGPSRWAVLDHEGTPRWGNQLNREAFVKLAKDPMKAMG